MINALTHIASATTNATQVVQLVCCKCETCFWVNVSQIVIAAFAVLSGIVALIKYFGDKKRLSPKLALKFEDCERYCIIGDDADEKESRFKMQTFLLRLDNVGSCPAKDCKVRVENVLIVSGGRLTEIRTDDTQSALLAFRQDSQKWPLELNNGDGVDLEICKIATNKTVAKGATTKDLSVVNDDACIHVLSDCGTLQILQPHQNHIRICVKVIAAMFTPKSYEFDIEWKGRTISAIGSAASYTVDFKEAR